MLRIASKSNSKRKTTRQDEQKMNNMKIRRTQEEK